MSDHEIDAQHKADVLQFVRKQSADDRIRAMVLDLVNQALRAQAIQLPNAEKDALAHEVLRNILLEMLGEYQDLFNQN